jgi:alkylation response protein AidB-like acyl-CoA dehydrogenase
MGAASIEKKENRFVRELISPSDKLVIDAVREFVDQEVAPVRREIEESALGDFELIDDVKRKFLSLGVQGGSFPEEYGGAGLNSALTLTIVAEELARGDASLFSGPSGEARAMRPAVLAGNKDALEHFAPGFLQEEGVYTGCFAMTEPSGGSNIENVDLKGVGINTTAELDGDHWVINGSKMWSVDSGIADVFCVVCNTDPSLGDDGIALIYVEVPTEGFHYDRLEDKAGLRGTREGVFRLDNVRVPGEWRAAGQGRDAQLLYDSIAFSRILNGALAIGCAQGALDEVLAFTSDRLAAGKPIRQHTIAASILAEIAIGIQVGRDSYVNAAYIFDRPDTYGPTHSRYMLSRSSIASVFCCDAAIKATNLAMELMGSYGYVTDYPVEKYWRDAKVIQLLEGGAQLGRLDVVRGYYEYNQFHRNELYEAIRKRS